MENKGGFIAMTSSPAGNAGIFGFSAYGATKAALNNLSHVLRAEYCGHNIRVHLLLPPDTLTPGYEKEILLYPKETKALLAGGGLCAPERVARKFVDGISRNKRQITLGLETHLLLFIVRHIPSIWEWYVRRKTS
jgi:short-subunit dehydrogenase